MKTWKKFAYSCVTLVSQLPATACGSLTGNKTASSSATTEDGLTNILMYQIGDAPKTSMFFWKMLIRLSKKKQAPI